MTPSHTPPPGHTPSEQSLIEHSSGFPIKVTGSMYDDFAVIIVEIVRLHDPEFHEGCLEKHPPSSGNYLGLTAIVRATSHEQLDMPYQALTSHPMVKVVL